MKIKITLIFTIRTISHRRLMFFSVLSHSAAAFKHSPFRAASPAGQPPRKLALGGSRGRLVHEILRPFPGSAPPSFAPSFRRSLPLYPWSCTVLALAKRPASRVFSSFSEMFHQISVKFEPFWDGFRVFYGVLQNISPPRCC